MRTPAVLFALAAAVAVPRGAAADTPQSFLDGYAREARGQNSAFVPSASRGDSLFHREFPGRNDATSCATCHTADPRRPGRTRAGKTIDPLAPAANAARFTDAAKVEKWFRRNCNDTLGRACTPAEKADVLHYLISLTLEK